ncbi:hypothetical protein [Lentzea pudingi]|uniref:hypothetical protein n=1 Tax=Lentzea pudingi TaxID=1789439 RepID=UPI00166C61BC|nr:hypothetical protein [Lentzea pudingi]
MTTWTGGGVAVDDAEPEVAGAAFRTGAGEEVHAAIPATASAAMNAILIEFFISIPPVDSDIPYALSDNQ